jgi:hypothetical protein
VSDALWVIARAPRVGFAKTRLGRTIGHEQAIILYRISPRVSRTSRSRQAGT